MKSAVWMMAFLAAVPAARLEAQTAAESKARPHVEALASERLAGRLAGSPGERLASEYIVSQLKRIGARPLPGRTDYRMPFEFTAGTRDGGTSIALSRGPGSGASPRAFQPRVDVQALSFSDNGEITGPVVFAGYGIVVPAGQDFAYDSYAMLDVKDKVVLVLRYFPEDADLKTKGILARYADLRYKAMAARQRGARAMLVVAGPRSPNAGATIPMTFDTALAGSGIVAASVSGAVGNAIFDALTDRSQTLEAAQKALDGGNPHVIGFDIPNLTVTVKTVVVREQRTGANVVGYLPATGPTAAIQKPWIGLGA